jgi:hypothetical protein
VVAEKSLHRHGFPGSGTNRAAFAAHKILVASDQVLSNQASYYELGVW